MPDFSCVPQRIQNLILQTLWRTDVFLHTCMTVLWHVWVVQNHLRIGGLYLYNDKYFSDDITRQNVMEGYNIYLILWKICTTEFWKLYSQNFLSTGHWNYIGFEHVEHGSTEITHFVLPKDPRFSLIFMPKQVPMILRYFIREKARFYLSPAKI